MAYALNFYHDQVAAEGATAKALAGAHRIVYVRHGKVWVNGAVLGAGQFGYYDGPVELRSVEAWSQVWRWDLVAVNAAPLRLEGTGVLSSLRMSRVIATLTMPPGSRWVLRLDQITVPAGHVADRHQHPGPGIRCLVEGTFNVQQDAESARELMPGDAWWETGSDTVVAWGSPQMPTQFVRGMVLPAEFDGKRTGTWLAGEPGTRSPRTNWTLHLDRVVTVT